MLIYPDPNYDLYENYSWKNFVRRFVNIQPGSRNGVLLVEIVTFEPKYKTIKILASFEVTV